MNGFGTGRCSRADHGRQRNSMAGGQENESLTKHPWEKFNWRQGGRWVEKRVQRAEKEMKGMVIWRTNWVKLSPDRMCDRCTDVPIWSTWRYAQCASKTGKNLRACPMPLLGPKKGGTLHFSSSIPRVLFPFFRLSKWQNIILDIEFTQLTATTWTNFGALHAYFSSLTVRRLYDVVAVFSSLYLCSTWFHYTYLAYIRTSWDTWLIHESSASILKVQQINMKPWGSSLQKMNSTDAISRARALLSLRIASGFSRVSNETFYEPNDKMSSANDRNRTQRFHVSNYH